jgi:uncharacterized protein YcaQ
VLLARIAGYRREWLDHWLYGDRRLYETYNKSLSIVPIAELPLYRFIWDRMRRRHEASAFDDHAPLVEELLARIRDEGTLQSRNVAARETIDWYWRPTNQVRAILEALAEVGTLGIARREGNHRVYDLAERLFPPAVLAERRPEKEQQAHRLLARYRAHGLLGASGNQELWVGGTGYAADRAAVRDQLMLAGRLAPIAVEGLRGDRFIVAEDLGDLDRAEREVQDGAPPGGVDPGVTFLAPLDPVCWDRDLLRRLFSFDYVWEVYVPASKRRWGYYVLPVLYGDRLVGRIEPRLDRRAGTLRLAGLWWEAGFDPLDEPGFIGAFTDALAAHRDFGDLAAISFPPGTRHRALATAVRGVLEVRGSKPKPVGRCTGRGSGGSNARKPPRKEAPDG